MSNIDNLDLPVPKYCSLHQAVHWLSTGERIISEKDFFRIYFDKPEEEMPSAIQFSQAVREIFIAARNDLLTAYGTNIDELELGSRVEGYSQRILGSYTNQGDRLASQSRYPRRLPRT